MPVFVDTNVLVYARDSSDPGKQQRAREWMEWLWRSRAGRTSQQVLHEYSVTVTRKLTPAMSVDEAREEIRDLLSWRPVAIDPDVLEEGWTAQDRYGLSFWDALIVAASRAAGCEYLLTEDLQDGQDLGGLTVLNPFTRTPASIA